MSSINPIKQILGIVRKDIDKRYANSARTTKTSDTSKTSTTDLIEQYDNAVKATGSIKEGLKAIVSIQLANEFGEAFLKDPESKPIINKIVNDLENSPDIKEILNIDRNL